MSSIATNLAIPNIAHPFFVTLCKTVNPVTSIKSFTCPHEVVPHLNTFLSETADGTAGRQQAEQLHKIVQAVDKEKLSLTDFSEEVLGVLADYSFGASSDSSDFERDYVDNVRKVMETGAWIFLRGRYESKAYSRAWRTARPYLLRIAGIRKLTSPETRTTALSTISQELDNAPLYDLPKTIAFAQLFLDTIYIEKNFLSLESYQNLHDRMSLSPKRTKWVLLTAVASLNIFGKLEAVGYRTEAIWGAAIGFGGMQLFSRPAHLGRYVRKLLTDPARQREALLALERLDLMELLRFRSPIHD